MKVHVIIAVFDLMPQTDCIDACFFHENYNYRLSNNVLLLPKLKVVCGLLVFILNLKHKNIITESFP